jgi:cysteine synthase
MARIYDDVTQMIGNTPLVRLNRVTDGAGATVLAKLEFYNPASSVKDRIGVAIIDAAERSGELPPGGTVVEATSGNTGIAFAALGRALGHPVRIYMPDWMSRERVALIQSFGAEIVPVSRDQGGFKGSIALADQWAKQSGDAFLPHQFANPANAEAHERTTGPEILCQFASIGVVPHAFIAGVGTGGTVMGVGRALKACIPGVRVHPLEPAESPTLRTGRKEGQHRIQGISDEFIPELVNLAELDEIVDVHDGDAILMAQQLCRAGLAVGISSGANCLGAIRVHQDLGAHANIVTILPDSNKKYLTTDLCRAEPARPYYLAPRIADIRWRGIACPGSHENACTCGFRHSCS